MARLGLNPRCLGKTRIESKMLRYANIESNMNSTESKILKGHAITKSIMMGSGQDDISSRHRGSG